MLDGILGRPGDVQAGDIITKTPKFPLGNCLLRKFLPFESAYYVVIRRANEAQY